MGSRGRRAPVWPATMAHRASWRVPTCSRWAPAYATPHTSDWTSYHEDEPGGFVEVFFFATPDDHVPYHGRVGIHDADDTYIERDCRSRSELDAVLRRVPTIIDHWDLGWLVGRP